MPGGECAGWVEGGEDGGVFWQGQEAGFCAFEVNIDALGVGFADGFLAGPAAEEGCVLLSGVEGGDFGRFEWGEDATPECGVDGVG